MKGLKDLLLKEQFRLETIIKETKNRLEVAPKGRLRLSKSHDHVQYYWCVDDKKIGDYIPKKKSSIGAAISTKII